MKSFALAVLTITILFAGTMTFSRLSSSSSEAAAPFQSNVTLEADTNRAGSDYRDFEIQADPRYCASACANDSTCRAYTYVKPGIQGVNAHCWLKNEVPNASANGCCVSGVKSGGESTPALEVNVNRRGGDYQDFELRSNNPYDCRDACQRDGRCASFTYVRPSHMGPYSHCFLKGSVPAATQENCCISGALRSGGTTGGVPGNNVGNFAGEWDTGIDGYAFYMVLSQSGNHVTGDIENGRGRLEGDVTGRTLRFHFTYSDSKGSGTYVLGDDGRTFKGFFSNTDDPNNNSRGYWNGRKR